MPSNVSPSLRQGGDRPFSQIEKDSFVSKISLIGWLAILASPFCTHFASSLQQGLRIAIERTLVEQISDLRKLKNLGTLIRYSRPVERKEYNCAVQIFADASRSIDHGKLCYITGLLIGKFE